METKVYMLKCLCSSFLVRSCFVACEWLACQERINYFKHQIEIDILLGVCFLKSIISSKLLNIYAELWQMDLENLNVFYFGGCHCFNWQNNEWHTCECLKVKNEVNCLCELLEPFSRVLLMNQWIEMEPIALQSGTR